MKFVDDDDDDDDDVSARQSSYNVRLWLWQRIHSSCVQSTVHHRLILTFAAHEFRPI